MKSSIRLLMAVALLSLGSVTQAALLFTYQDVGAHLQVTVSGSFDTGGTFTTSSGNGGSYVVGISGDRHISMALIGNFDEYLASSGNFTVNQNPFTINAAGTSPEVALVGDLIAFDYDSGVPQLKVYVPENYTSGSAINSTWTMQNLQIADLGINSGTIFSDIGGVSGNNISVAVPEPTANGAALLLAGLGLTYASRRRKKRLGFEADQDTAAN